ncbi:MAG: 2-amino-4-hydroxy-6-hydroxymethyldihydropteridine diphosphokinase [Dehalococcoidales bacterium]|nr:2-amino-4-hydroxy-6-hydroxymethyldihydropteridine diphosphokinase [Dehalococcoidales bacterium]
MTDMVTAYLSLGSNLGNRQENLDMALKLLSQRMRLGKISSIYDTEPVGDIKQPRFLNLCCEVFTRLSPEGLLALAKGIEGKMGRRGRSGEPRPIDIDILLYGDAVINTPDLVIPHPRMAERAFVLVPLAEIAPSVVHPVLKKTIKELRKAVKEVQGVLKLDTTS